jgi:hypothetical protein
MEPLPKRIIPGYELFGSKWLAEEVAVEELQLRERPRLARLLGVVLVFMVKFLSRI